MGSSSSFVEIGRGVLLPFTRDPIVFMTFLFVDRITEIEPGRRARGRFAVPPDLPWLPGWLVVEAIGQLVAWTAMAAVDFRARPVAARGGEVRVRGVRNHGRSLSLSAHIDRCDDSVVVYRGEAELDGAPVGSLHRCVGPMLPMEEFDDPEVVRRHFERLCGDGERRQIVAEEIPIELPLTVVGGRRGESRSVRLDVPKEAAFFADHFPRREVFPGTLLLDAEARAALDLAAEAFNLQDASGVRLLCVRDVKVRAFTGPGHVIAIDARVRSARHDFVEVAVVGEADGKRMATARIDIGRAAGQDPPS